MADISADTQAALREAVGLDASLKALIDDELRVLDGAGFVKRSLTDAFVRRGLGMPLPQVRAEIERSSAVLRGVAGGEIGLESARADLRAYARLIDRIAHWVESLEPMAAGRIKDASRRQEVLRQGRERVDEARRLSGVLARL